MFINSLLFILLILFSIGIFFINNIIILGSILVVCIILSFLLKIKLPIYLPFVILILINFLLNLLLSNLFDAVIVTERLLLMFLSVNIFIKKVGIYNLSYIIGNITRSKSITLILLIALSFIPIMMKELLEIRRSLVTKNYPLNIRNILKRPSVFVVTFFSNLFKRVNDMEKVLLSKGISEDYQ